MFPSLNGLPGETHHSVSLVVASFFSLWKDFSSTFYTSCIYYLLTFFSLLLFQYIADNCLENNPWHGVDEWALKVKEIINWKYETQMCVSRQYFQKPFNDSLESVPNQMNYFVLIIVSSKIVLWGSPQTLWLDFEEWVAQAIKVLTPWVTFLMLLPRSFLWNFKKQFVLCIFFLK